MLIHAQLNLLYNRSLTISHTLADNYALTFTFFRDESFRIIYKYSERVCLFIAIERIETSFCGNPSLFSMGFCLYYYFIRLVAAQLVGRHTYDRYVPVQSLVEFL